MDILERLIYLTSAYPLLQAWLANRSTTLLHAMNWAVAAWLAWLSALLIGGDEGAWAVRYLAVCLTGCVGIAVLGARRPIAGAWNFVVLGLLGVLLLPVAENAMLATPLLDPLRLVLLIGTIAVGVLNYLPTRLAMCTVLLGAACGVELLLLTGRPQDGEWRLRLYHISHWLLPAACWCGWLGARRRWAGVAEFDRDWLTFRDRFGLIWAQRIREQFNRAAAHAGWPVCLRWPGLHKTTRDVKLDETEQTIIVDTLREMLKRFNARANQ